MRHNRFNGFGGYNGMYSAPTPTRPQCALTDAPAGEYDLGDDCVRGVTPTLAIATVPFQAWNGTAFEDDNGLKNGTIFPELVLPFCGGGCV